MEPITERQLDLFFAYYHRLLVHLGWSQEKAALAREQLIAGALCRQSWRWSAPMRVAWEAAGIAGKPSCKPLFDAVREIACQNPDHKAMLESIEH